MSFPNQKRIIINKEPCDNRRNIYAQINLAAIQKAMSELTSAGEIKLWMYLAKNQNNHIFNLSLVDCKKYGIKTDAYHAAVKKLISKGYLQHKSGNTYYFKEIGTSTENPQTL